MARTVTYQTGSGTGASPYRTTITVLRPGKDPVSTLPTAR